MSRSRMRIVAASQLILPLILLAVVAFWVVSYQTYQHLSKGGPSATGYVLTSFRGELVFQHRTGWEYEGSFFWRKARARTAAFPLPFRIDEPGVQRYTVLGCGLWTGTQYVWPAYLYSAVTPTPSQADPRWQKNRYTAIVIPYWLITLVLTAAQVRVYVVRRRSRAIQRMARGLCPRCGYDLRATPTQCPECGAKVPLPSVFNPSLNFLRVFAPSW